MRLLRHTDTVALPVRSCARIAALVACMVGGVPASARAQGNTTSALIQLLLGDSTQYRDAITGFQKAVKAHDAAAVAAMVNYPIKVRIVGSSRTIRTPQEFIVKYDSIITPAIAAAVQDQKWDDLFVNYQGVMLGRGEVWFNGTCRDKDCKVAPVRIYTIQSTANLDPAPGSGN